MHIVVAATHCFDQTVTETVIQVRVESEYLIVFPEDQQESVFGPFWGAL